LWNVKFLTNPYCWGKVKLPSKRLWNGSNIHLKLTLKCTKRNRTTYKFVFIWFTMWCLCTYYICPCRVYRMFQRWREKIVEVQNYRHYWNNNVKMYTALCRIHISRIRGTILVRVSVKTFHYHLKSHHIVNQIKTNLYVVLFRLVHFRVNLRWMLLPFQRRLLGNFTFPQQ
jgi:hypothetical protein